MSTPLFEILFALINTLALPAPVHASASVSNTRGGGAL